MPVIPLTSTALLLLLTAAAGASDRVAGEASFFQSPAAVRERCVVVSRAPGGAYSIADAEAERALCGIDFYAPDIALCPRTWGDRPASVVYRLPGAPQAGDARRFEHRVCVLGRAARDEASAELAVYKQSVNGGKTRLTFAPAALLYYHLSRYFDTDVQVPVAVFRTMDRRVHRNRVSKRGGALTTVNPALRTLRSAWSRLTKVEALPGEYDPAGELFTSDGEQIHGALQHPRPPRDGVDTRAVSERSAPSRDGVDAGAAFAGSAPWRALHSEEPPAAAAQQALAEARRDPLLAPRLASASTAQMLYWMKELSEVALLDFLLDQRERDVPLELEAAWAWVEGDRLRWRAADTPEVPGDLVARRPLRFWRSWIRDNDAVGLARGDEAAQPGAVLAGVRHLHADTFRRLLALDRDLRSGGPLRDWLAGGFGLSEAQLAAIARRARIAAGQLGAVCRDRTLRFDLDPDGFVVAGRVEARAVHCPDP